MRIPLQTQFRGMEPSDFVANNVWDHVEKLERFYDRILSCHVIISAPHRHKHHGKIYHVQVTIHLPGTTVCVSTEHEKNHAHEDVYVAIRDAFDSARRRIEDFVQRRRRVHKNHAYAVKTADQRSELFMENPNATKRFSPGQMNALRNELVNRRRLLSETERSLEEEGLRGLAEETTDEISHVRLHPADLGSDEAERDLMLSLADSEIREIQDIDDALIKMQNQTYGICETCGGEIPFARLKVHPYARHCLACEIKAARA